MGSQLGVDVAREQVASVDFSTNEYVMSLHLIEMAREFYSDPKNREAFEEWKKERGANDRSH